MKFWRTIRSLGPTLITAALIFGPGSLTVTTKLGAAFQYQLLWVIVLSILFMLAYTKLSAHLGLVIDGSLIGEVRKTYGRSISMFLGIGIFCISASFQAGNAIGAGVSCAQLFGGTSTLWIVVISASAAALLFLKSFYRVLEKIMIFLVIIMILSFLITLILSAPSFVDVVQGLLPSIPNGSEFLSIALVASSFSIVGAFYQSSLVKEKGWTLADLSLATQESRLGIIALGCLSALVMICAGSVLFENDQNVNTAADLGKALKPLFGQFSTTVFMIGFLAASYSSLLGNATIGGSLLADGFNLGNNFNDRKVKAMIILVIIIGSSVAIKFGRLPLNLIVFAQAITILVAPAAAFSILLVAYRKKVFRPQLSRPQTWLLLLGLLLLIVLAAYNFYRIFLVNQ